MLAITDIAIITFLIILAANGSYQGLLRALVGPVSLLLSLVLCVFIYFGTKSFAAAFLTAVLGPFFFAWIIMALLKNWLNSEEAPRLSLVSRVGGLVVNVLWGSVVIFLIVSLLAFFPFNRFDLPGVSKDIRRSFAFRLIQPMFLNKAMESGEDALRLANCETSLCSASEEDLKAIAADPTVMAIMNDPRIISLQDDPVAQKAIETRNFRALLDLPSVRALTQDPGFLMKVIKVYPKLQAIMNASDMEGKMK